ncbi:MAG TPA: hypothetical protein PK096_01680 [Candidatus Saccharibacteria bacterium]|nr:hypothetical protein [Candidatus Saccharibacteria bacterium]HRK94056.1 hypothetical protein [Candidatus Saccharibacteria bacterium]
MKREFLIPTILHTVVAIGVVVGITLGLGALLGLDVVSWKVGLYLAIGICCGLYEGEQSNRSLREQWRDQMPRVHDDYAPDLVRLAFTGPLRLTLRGLIVAFDYWNGLRMFVADIRQSRRALPRV